LTGAQTLGLYKAADKLYAAAMKGGRTPVLNADGTPKMQQQRFNNPNFTSGGSQPQYTYTYTPIYKIQTPNQSAAFGGVVRYLTSKGIPQSQALKYAQTLGPTPWDAVQQGTPGPRRR
jgi:hypothetical protein